MGAAAAAVVVSAYGILSGKNERDKARERAKEIMATYGLQYKDAMYYAAQLEESAGLWDSYDLTSQSFMNTASVAMDVSAMYQDSVRVAIENNKFMKNQELQMLKNGIDMVGTPLLVLQETMNASDTQLEIMDRKAENTLKLGEMNSRMLMLSGKVKKLQGEQSAISTRKEAQAEQTKALNV